MNIVLLEPEIPHNTGAIGRTCHITGTKLHLIKPLGFSIDEKHIRRTGLDYWRSLSPSLYESFEDFMSRNLGARLIMATTKAKNRYDRMVYREDDFIMFGKESKGIPEEILLQYPDTAVRVPMIPDARSLNLSVSVGIVLYEALRQLNFPGLETEGRLHVHEW